MYYRVYWNTGDEYWDRDPDEEVLTLEELRIDDRLNLTEEDIEELLEFGCLSDSTGIVWTIKRVY